MSAQVSIIMPTYDCAHFIARALRSLLKQRFNDWELVLIDDGSGDSTFEVLSPFLQDHRIRFRRQEQNIGLGAVLNMGIEMSSAPLIAYLPADDLYFSNHLTVLYQTLTAWPDAILAFSGARHHYNREALSPDQDCPLQLVQVMHRRTSERWLERRELVTDDLHTMYWSKLEAYGAFVPTQIVTCEWTDHPQQRHKILREPEGGINLYRRFYRTHEPLKIHTANGNPLDEHAHFRRFREREMIPQRDGMRILLVGELAYNPECVLALAEAGHRLYGLWIENPHWYNSVGPLPFGHVEELNPRDWKSEIERVHPDLIYALLNWQPVTFVKEVLHAVPHIPAVWHFKEGPFACIEKGTWRELVDIYGRADGAVFSSVEMKDWFKTALPFELDEPRTLVLDGDLPKADWFTNGTAPKLSGSDGEIHTVVPGRPIGLHPDTVAALAAEGVHVHVYGDFVHGQWKAWIEKTLRLAPRHLHLHGHIDQGRWVPEFSLYDAGWLHFFESQNGGDITRANWDDLNIPARLPTLAAAGIPALQRENFGSRVAMQTVVRELETGIFFKEPGELAASLRDRKALELLQRRVWECRHRLTFDYHVERLVAFFKTIISGERSRNAGSHGRRSCFGSSPLPSRLCED